MSNFLQTQNFITFQSEFKEFEDYLQERSIIKPVGKTDYLWFSLFRGVCLKYIGENICADEFFLLNNIFVSFQIDVPITIRFDSCYLTISKSHFSVQQIRNIYLILNVQPFVQKKKKRKNPHTCFKLNFLPNLKSNCNKDKRQFY